MPKGSSQLQITIVCDDAALAVECARIAGDLEIRVAPTLSRAPIEDAVRCLGLEKCCAIALAKQPDAEHIIALAHASFSSGSTCVLADLGPREGVARRNDLAADLGLIAVSEIRPMLASLALIAQRAATPWTAATRALSSFDRARIGLPSVPQNNGRLVPMDDGRIGYASDGRSGPSALGEPRDVGDALRAMQRASGIVPPGRAVIEGVDGKTTAEVLFGPPRALSDPASKAALAPYGLPLPIEELCSSPSRAAAEASRIGFPVRIALASPDLRIWDHPDLAVDGVDGAARVRDVFRQIMSMATERDPNARLLGVSVSATTTDALPLTVKAIPASYGWVYTEVGFADPHGLASADSTSTILPASVERIERAISRLKGASLLLEGSTARRRAVLAALADALLRLAAFVDRHRDEIVSVELRPLSVLVGGGVEIKEACVTVGDRFLRSLDPVDAPSP